MYYLLASRGKSGELSPARRGILSRRMIRITRPSVSCGTDRRELGKELACRFHIEDFFPGAETQSPETLDAIGCTIQITNIVGVSEHNACILSIGSGDPDVRRRTLPNPVATSMVDARVHGIGFRVFGPALLARYDSVQRYDPVKKRTEFEAQYMPLTPDTLALLQHKFAITMVPSSESTPSHGGRREEPCPERRRPAPSPERLTLDQYRAKTAASRKQGRDGLSKGTLVVAAGSKDVMSDAIVETPRTDLGSESVGPTEDFDGGSDISEVVVLEEALLLESALIDNSEPPPPPPPRRRERVPPPECAPPSGPPPPEFAPSPPPPPPRPRPRERVPDRQP